MTQVPRHLLTSQLLLTLVLLGCALVRPTYSVVLRNDAGESIRDAYVKFDDFVSMGGHLAAGKAKTYLDVTRPIPDAATVEWRTGDGELQVREVAVRSRVPRRFGGGDLIFTIRQDGSIAFRAETWAEQDARDRAEHTPIFEPGELAIDSDTADSNPYTEGLAKWSHPELEASTRLRDPGGLLVELSSRIKRDGAHFGPGDRVEVGDEAICFVRGERSRVLAQLCREKAPTSTDS